jgi:hypothetical protein
MSLPPGFYPNWNAFDWTFGQRKWYRRWRGGLWAYSDFTHKWWRHEAIPNIPNPPIEDYR